jgi:hypothetical protein
MPERGVKRRIARNIVLWVVAISVVLMGIVIVLGAAIYPKVGEPLIESPEALLGTIVTAVGGLLVVLLPMLLRSEQNSEVIRNEVKNSHSTNLRDDLDDNHTSIVEALKEILLKQSMSDTSIERLHELAGGTRSDVRGLRRDIGRLADGYAELGSRVLKVEQKHEEVLRTQDEILARMRAKADEDTHPAEWKEDH